MTKSSAANIRATKIRRKTDSNNIGLWIVGISAAIVLVVVLGIALSSRQPTIAVAAPDLPKEWLVRTTMGDSHAPVTIQAWEDFVCPACRSWTSTVEPKLIDEYIKTGKVKMGIPSIPALIHAPGSYMAAQASLCANEQGGFWTYHNLLFPAQDQGQAGFTIDKLAAYADQAGMDSKALLDCMSSQKFKQAVDDSGNQAIGLGLNATPSIIVDGVHMNDPYKYEEEVKPAIEAALAKAGQ